MTMGSPFQVAHRDNKLDSTIVLAQSAILQSQTQSTSLQKFPTPEPSILLRIIPLLNRYLAINSSHHSDLIEPMSRSQFKS